MNKITELLKNNIHLLLSVLGTLAVGLVAIWLLGYAIINIKVALQFFFFGSLVTVVSLSEYFVFNRIKWVTSKIDDKDGYQENVEIQAQSQLLTTIFLGNSILLGFMLSGVFQSNLW